MRRLLCMGLVMVAACFLASPAAASCREVKHLDQVYIACTFDPAVFDLQVFHRGRDGRPFGGFATLETELRREQDYLVFAMNGGMYETDLSPVGLLVTGGVERKPLDRGSSWGNFYLKPNGVFFIRDGKAGVMETEAYAAAGISPYAATQSGPMLVIDGALHPAFLPQSDSLQIRNGVGVKRDGRAVFVMANEKVRFHDFATLFRDVLDCPDALFLDGSISSLFAPELNRYDSGNPMGPIIAVTAKMPGAT